MKKFFVKVLYVIILNLLVLLAFNYNINNIIKVAINKIGIKEELNIFFYIYINSKNVDSNNKQYEIVSDIDYSMFSSDNIEETIKSNNIVIYYIKKYKDKLVSYGITEREIEELIVDLNNNTNKLNYKIGKKEKIALNLYKVISWNLLKYIILLILVISIIILFFIEKIKVYKGVGIDFFISGIIIEIISIIISKTFNINFYYFNSFVILYILFGIVLVVEYIILNKRMQSM